MIYTEVKIPYPPFPSTPLLTIQKTKLAVYSVHITMATNVSQWVWRDTLPFLPYHTTNIARWPPLLNPIPEIYSCIIFTLTKSFLSRKGVRGYFSVLSMANWLFLTRCPALRWTAPTQWPDPPCWTSQTPAFQSSKQGSAPPNQSDPCCSLWRRKRARKAIVERTQSASSTSPRPPPALFTPFVPLRGGLCPGFRPGPKRPQLTHFLDDPED